MDDVLPPWKPRMLEIRGTVEGLPDGGKDIAQTLAPEILRITPTRILSFGLSSAGVQSERPAADFASRKVE